MTLNQQTLNQIMNEETFKEILEKAKELSKKQFLLFGTQALGANKETWDRLWNTPIIASYEGDTLIQNELSEKEYDDVLDIIDSTIASELGNAEGVTIPFYNFDDESCQVLSAIKSDQYEDVIVYSKKGILENIKNKLDENDAKSIDKIKSIAISYIAKMLTHEMCHVNDTYRIDEGVENEVTTIHGARGTYDSYEENDLFNFYIDQDEVLTDTIALMIMRSKEGDSVEDCLIKVLRDRGGKNTYKDYDDRQVLLLMTLFPEELSEWVMLGAYENSYHNLLAEKGKEVFGEHPEFARNLEKTVANYFNKMDKSQLTREELKKRIMMLELMGVKVENIIGIEQIKELAESEEGMDNLENGAAIINNIENDKINERSIEE